MSQWIKFKETTVSLPILLLDCVARGFNNYFTADHDGRTQIKNYGQFLHARWFGEKDFGNYQRMLTGASPVKLLCWVRAYQTKKMKLLNFTSRISALNYKNITDRCLLRIFFHYIDLCARAYHYTYDYVILNTFYPEKINFLILNRVKNVEILNKYLPHLAGATKPLDIHKSQKHLGKIAFYVKEKGFDPVVQQEIKRYLKRYAYMNMFSYFGEAFTENDIKKTIQNLVKKNKKEIIRETISKYNQILDNAQKTREFIKKFKLGKNESEVINVFQEYIFTSLWADELYHKVPYLVRPLFKEIGRRFNFSYKHIIYMTVDEIERLFSGRAKRALIDSVNARMRDFAFVLENSQRKILVGRVINKKFAREIAMEKAMLRTKEIKGTSACSGCARGRVQVIRVLDDIKNFRRNRILVTVSTAPVHLPAMTRALAIITEEGGLLSHAAIVSRELNKPCIIGTKIATKVLKDGDLVEVDAKRGTVKIIKKA